MLPFLFLCFTHADSLSPIRVQPNAGLTTPEVITPRDDGPATLFEALRNSGVTALRAGGPGQPTSIFIRGASSEQTLVLVDGIEVNHPGHPTGGFDDAAIDTQLIERVEIFKGPQSARFGPGAAGGVINIITKEGNGPASLLLHARAGSYQTNQGAAAVLGSEGRINFALSASRFETAGFSAAKDGTEKDGFQKSAFNSRLGYRWSEDGSATLITRSAFSRADLDYSLIADDPDYHARTESLANAVLLHERWSPRWESHATLAHYKVNSSVDAQNLKFEIENRLAVSEHFKVSFGPSHRRESTRSEMHTTGAFAVADLKNGQFIFTVGERVDFHSRYGTFFSHSVSPTYVLGGTKFSARASTGFKSPSLYQLYDPSFGDQNLQPEKVFSQELGIDQQIAREHLLSLSLFRNQSRDLIQFTNRYANVRAASGQGFELEYRGQFGFLATDVAYNYLQTRDESTGLSLPRRPMHHWLANARYLFRERWRFSATFRHLGERADVDALGGSRVTSPSFQTWDASAGARLAAVTWLSLSVENIFNRDYQQINGYSSPGLAGYVDLQTRF